MSKLFLVDGSNLLFQMFFGMPARIAAPDGRPMQGTVGFVGALLKMLRRVQPTHALVLFDGEHRNPRADEDADYKANRIDYSALPAEENPFSQYADICAALDVMGIARYETETCEADDLIAAYALAARARVVISSLDSDLLQLVSDRVTVLRYRGEQSVLCTPDYVLGRYGVHPHQFADFKALTGDPSDNIKGVEKVGPKTAAALLSQFGTLEGVLAGVEHIQKPSVRESIRRDADRLRRNLRLIRLGGCEDLPLTAAQLAYTPTALASGEILARIGLR